jgi:Type II secretion system (T2SS), protein E, N-terminal domain
MPILSNKPASIRERAESILRSSRLEHFPPTESFSRSNSDLRGLERGPRPLPASPRTECVNPACAGGWTMPWRSRRRPTFEGSQACKGACLEGVVKAAVVRERGDRRVQTAPEPHRHRIPLGLILLAQGWITHPQLQKALEAQRVRGAGRIGDLLVSECGLDADRVTRGLSVQWGCPVLTTDGFSPQAMALVLPEPLVREYGILPLRVAGSTILYVGFQDHLDASAAFAAERMNGLRTESGVVGEDEFEAARERLLNCSFPASSTATVADADALSHRIAGLVEQKQPANARLIRLHRHYWLRLWLESDRRPIAGAVPASVEAVNDYLFTIGAEA